MRGLSLKDPLEICLCPQPRRGTSIPAQCNALVYQSNKETASPERALHKSSSICAFRASIFALSSVCFRVISAVCFWFFRISISRFECGGAGFGFFKGGHHVAHGVIAASGVELGGPRPWARRAQVPSPWKIRIVRAKNFSPHTAFSSLMLHTASRLLGWHSMAHSCRQNLRFHCKHR